MAEVGKDQMALTRLGRILKGTGGVGRGWKDSEKDCEGPDRCRGELVGVWGHRQALMNAL